MSIRKVVRYGEDSLRQPSKEVHKVSQKVKNLVADLQRFLLSLPRHST